MTWNHNPVVFPAPPKPRPTPRPKLSPHPLRRTTTCDLCGAKEMPCGPRGGLRYICVYCFPRVPTLPFDEPLDPRPIR